MSMITLAAVLAASLAFASEPALKPFKVISTDGNFVNARYLLTAGAGSVGVWDLAGPKQIALVQIPDYEVRSGELNGVATDLYLWDVTTDGKWALVTLQKRKWAKAGEGYTGAQSELFLISVPEQKVVRTLADTGTHGCDTEYGIVGVCPGVWNVLFSPDGKTLTYRVETELRAEHVKESVKSPFGYWTNLVHHKRETSYFADLSGKSLDKRAYDSVDDMRQKDSQWVSTPLKPLSGFLPDGSPALLFVDGAGCAVKTLAGKQVSFLDDCTAEAKPAFGRGRVSSSAGPFTLWDPATGTALKRSTPLPENRSAVTDDFSQIAEVALDTTATPATAALRVVDAATGRLALERLLELPPGEYLPSGISYSRADGRLAIKLYTKEYKYSVALYKTGAAAPAPMAAAPAAPEIDVDSPPASKSKTDPDSYAVVIGVEKYRQEGIPAVDYAARDAQTMYAYLTRSMGFDVKNVVLLTDEKATKTDFEKNLGKWLRNRVGAKSRVFVYYAGHGAPNAATGEGYLMPYEADPNYVEETAYPISRLYAELAKLPTQDVTVVLDACFSGQGGRSLIAKGARPLVAVKEAKGPRNAVVLAAATGGQISATDPERRHGLLTEYLLEALHGAADTRGDGKITAEEVYAYVRPAVERAARLQNIEQTPTVSPAPEELKGGRSWIELK